MEEKKAQTNVGVIGTVRADEKMGTGLREGTRAQVIRLLDDGRVQVRVVHSPDKEQMVTVVPGDRFVPGSLALSDIPTPIPNPYTPGKVNLDGTVDLYQ